ncbi:leucine-rich repeat domain, L domain-like protein [Artemisia annua]|uniref:Leucine-rich repeat domain, L domain-like protein n=1 Tax=Artemisia annua TaxID=35608 RepID=A0A2U1NTP1_ARTAN|nr:leucine-rich repeat domain, L domain-like protein [Artemisia annua]PWA76827.1 leucine-rich repeat domain, L domain-like protein [Artemisia annua]
MDVGFNKQLPDDSWDLIFKKLDSNVDRNSFGLTCHSFLDIQSSSYKSLKFGCSSGESNCSIHVNIHDFVFNEHLFKRFTQLESLSLGTCLSIKDSGLTPFVKYGSKLLSLNIDFCHNVTDIGLTLVASSCPLLSVISLAECSITDSGLEILTKLCKSLKEVNLAWCTNITDRGILSLNQNSRQLRSLNITGCGKIAGLTFQGFSPTLACLEAANCGLDSTGINEILSGGGLKYLNLSCLSFSKFDSSHKLAAFIGIGSAANLRFLNLFMCLFVEDSVIIAISKGCPLLQEWNLSCCGMIGISGWESIGSYCQNLEILHVGCCFELCDRGLLALGNGCKRLSVIYMKYCFKVTASGLHLFKVQRDDIEIKEEILLTKISRMRNF